MLFFLRQLFMMHVCVCVCVRACVHACVLACVHACVRLCCYCSLALFSAIEHV